MLRADLADAEAERTRALRLVVGVLGRHRVERALANGGIGSWCSGCLRRAAAGRADRVPATVPTSMGNIVSVDGGRGRGLVDRSLVALRPRDSFST